MTSQPARQAVVDSAHTLFVERGYRATSMTAIAERAGVSAASVTKSFGSKEALAKAAFDVALAGDHDEVDLANRPEAAEIAAEPTAAGKLTMCAAQTADRHRRTVAIQQVIRDGRHGDQALALVWDTVQEERLRAMMAFAQHLLLSGGLRPGAELEEVGDVLWWVTSVDHYELLVLGRGWSQERYAAWVRQLLVTTLL